MKFRDCNSMTSTENIQEDFKNGLVNFKTYSSIRNLCAKIIYANHMLTSVLVSSNGQGPYQYTITARTLVAKWADYQFQRLILQFLALRKNYRIASNVHHNPSIKFTSRCCAKRTELAHVLCDKPFPEVRTNRSHFLINDFVKYEHTHHLICCKKFT